MSQNRSSAVMAQRREPPDSLDYYPTPPWGTRALCEVVLCDHPLGAQTCWEPACGEGDMTRPLREYFKIVRTSDIFDYDTSEQNRVCDFLGIDSIPPVIEAQGVDWIVTNPPFNAAEQFTRKALSIARIGVAILARASWMEGIGRDGLFTEHPLAIYAPFIERLPMFKGRLHRKGASATAYAWFVWKKGESVTRLVRIPPGSKRRFDRDEDWRRAGVNAPPIPLLETVSA